MEFEKERNEIKKTLRLKFYSIGTPYSSGVHARFLVWFVWLIMVFCVPITSTNVLNSNQTCTRGSDELGRHVSQSNKEKIMMGQYIDLEHTICISYCL
jgi:hypothetical protein